MFVDDIPEKLSCLNELELFLIRKRFSFKKLLIMPKDQAPKLHGAIVNVPVGRNRTYSLLPNTEYIIMVKLTKKGFKGHVFFDQVRPEKFYETLTYLKCNYQLYSDFQIDEDNILQLLVNVCTEEIPVALDDVHEDNGSKVNDTAIEDEEEISNPLQNYQQQVSKLLQ